jgi:hypothetical protein
VPDLSPAVIQAAANALLATWHPRDNPEEQARLVYAAHETATEIMAAAAPLIRAEALERALAAITAQRDDEPCMVTEWSDGYESGVDHCETAIRGLVEEGTE